MAAMLPVNLALLTLAAFVAYDRILVRHAGSGSA
jgi:hypothetical protein